MEFNNSLENIRESFPFYFLKVGSLKMLVTEKIALLTPIPL